MRDGERREKVRDARDERKRRERQKRRERRGVCSLAKSQLLVGQCGTTFSRVRYLGGECVKVRSANEGSPTTD